MSKRIRNTLYIAAFPALTYLVMETLCLLLKGKHLINFDSMLDIKTIVRNTGIATIIAFALSFNMSSGRFDLSLGAQRLAGTIIGGIVALKLGLSGIPFLLLAFFFGLLFGLVTGLVFVAIRIPPMVLGVGLGLVWECVPYVVSQGKGLNLFGVTGMEILTDMSFVIVLMVLVSALVSLMVSSTRFGYQLRAIQGSQTIARSNGINIFRHAVICYTLAGALVCVAGVMDVSFSTQMTATLGMASNGVIVANMFPMMLGNYLARRSNQAVGIIVASLSVKLFSFGLTSLELSEPNANVMNMVAFVGFLVLLANKDFFKHRKAEQARVALAHDTKAALQIAEA